MFQLLLIQGEEDNASEGLLGFELLSTNNLSSGSSSSDPDSDSSSNITTPLFSPVTSEGSFSDLSSPATEPESDSSAMDETGTFTWLSENEWLCSG